MTRAVVHPSTLEGIKRLAKSIKRERNIGHSQALNEAAKAAGFQNLRHAQNGLPTATTTPRNPLYLTAYWRSREGATGRETLLIFTEERWADSLRPQEFRRARGLHHFRVDAPDHLETAKDINGQESARKLVCAAARTIQFMEATGLRPATARTLTFERTVDGLPDRDHSTLWVDPDTRRLVLTDEPYNDSAEFTANRDGWARSHGMTIAKPTWAGMYVPGSSALYLISDAASGGPLDLLVRRLNALPSPVVAEEWRGESAPSTPVLVTPGRRASGRIKRERPRQIEMGETRNGAVAYGTVFLGMQWRPNGRMSVSSHKQAGRLLKAVMNSDHLPRRAEQRINHVRSELDEWVQCEYTVAELPHEVFSELYYGTADTIGMKAADMIDRISTLLSRSYPDCAPLRDLLRSLESARRAAMRTHL